MNPLHQKFILEWLKTHKGTDCLDSEFHDKFHQQFGGKRKEYLWGASPVVASMKALATMYRCGILSRGIVSITGGIGFPKWVYVYSLKRD